MLNKYKSTKTHNTIVRHWKGHNSDNAVFCNFTGVDFSCWLSYKRKYVPALFKQARTNVTQVLFCSVIYSVLMLWISQHDITVVYVGTAVRTMFKLYITREHSMPSLICLYCVTIDAEFNMFVLCDNRCRVKYVCIVWQSMPSLICLYCVTIDAEFNMFVLCDNR